VTAITSLANLILDTSHIGQSIQTSAFEYYVLLRGFSAHLRGSDHGIFLAPLLTRHRRPGAEHPLREPHRPDHDPVEQPASALLWRGGVGGLLTLQFLTLYITLVIYSYLEDAAAPC